MASLRHDELSQGAIFDMSYQYQNSHCEQVNHKIILSPLWNFYDG